VFTLRSPSPERRSHFLARERVAPLTYAEVGASLGWEVGASLGPLEALPDGYHHDHGTMVVGHGDRDFARAVEGIHRFVPLTAAGIDVFPPDAPIEVGTTVGLVMRIGPTHALAACRVVAVVDEPARKGFAYGTLPSHPATGEELFVATRDVNDDVRFDVVAFSKPHDLLTRLGAPVARRVQARAARKYLEGLRDYVSAT